MTSAGFVDAKGLGESPLDAAARFHAHIVPSIRAMMANGSELVVMFDPADHSHTSWRKAAIEELAREAAPCRINGVIARAQDKQDTAQTIQFLHKSPGITGQILQVDGNCGDKD